MPVLTVGNTVYTHPVAKVMISIPDEILERIDAHLRETRESRSGFLRRLAEREIEAESPNRRRELEDLLGPPVPMGGDAVRLIREDRESH
ncbi:MAG TPA: type II toxin-antitoxin system HicB family antitoxin [Solirubrobacterales bacterium]|nr:type II toxin-antitoxin system HicB family antitoxin [Solirubrobacterales bacterium]